MSRVCRRPGAFRLQGLAACAGCACRDTAQGGRRGDFGQDQHSRRHWRLAELQRCLRHYQQSVGSWPHARRLIRRRCGVGCRRLCRARTRLRPQWLHSPACPLLWRLRPQAKHWPGAIARPCAAALAGNRRHGTVGLGVVGPLARTADDLELALGLIAGPDDADGLAYRLTLPPSRRERLAEFRVLVVDAHPLMPTAHAVGDALDRLVEKLVRQGAHVARTSPLLPDLARAARLHQKLVIAFSQAFPLPPEDYRRIEAAAAHLFARRPKPRGLAAARHQAPPRVDRGQRRARAAAGSMPRTVQGV